MVVNTNEPNELKDVIRDLKKFTAKKVIQQIQEEPESRRKWMLNEFEKAGRESKKHSKYKFWQEGNYAVEVYSPYFTWIKIRYIHNNPVKAGLVRKPEDWKYSSASNYMDSESVLDEVFCIPPILISI